MSDRLIVSIDAHVAEVVLNRPDKYNAVDFRMFDELGEMGAKLATEASLRAVVLRGEGDNFCAGIDVSAFTSSDVAIDATTLAPLEGRSANRLQFAATVWRDLPVPVICAINGVAYGAGLQIALGADIRFASARARLSIMEIKWGLIPDLGISVTARNLLRNDILRELAYTGRVVSGREAQELGLVTALEDDPVEAARALARSIAGHSPDAIRGMKKLFNESAVLDDAGSLALEAALQGRVLSGRNQAEAVRANMAGCEPEFEDPVAE
jgi:enoyl-CoA hydratase/carnithine racemase